jgi:hypothetical protein
MVVGVPRGVARLRYSRSCRESGLAEEGVRSLNLKAALLGAVGGAGLESGAWG